MATLVSVLIGTVPAAVQQFVQRGASDGSWTLSHTPVFEQLAGISNVVSQGTLTVIGKCPKGREAWEGLLLRESRGEIKQGLL